eukprot:CAMPEP_0196799824 /NCGR_PEP_ID=MMETSP1104-20130614/39833_1 /TAXON_ID=33652 /ORGANISM="Cafeteria sp., Strain Caron Lab Isolate" /LENGTH=395 /DNA_ID=CAMNT_0042170233 /DNA_START=1 /DNA_END=1184 /DNA_ORIENTATION=+
MCCAAEQALSMSAAELAAKIGLPEETVAPWHTGLVERMAAPKVNGAVLYREVLDEEAIFSTYQEGLDCILGRGLFTGDVVELVGPSSSGKTQMCHWLAAAVAVRGGSVAYFDATNSFSSARLLHFATAIEAAGASQTSEGHTQGSGSAGDATSVSSAAVLRSAQRVRRIPVFTVPDALKVIDGLRLALADSEDPWSRDLRLLVLDSMHALAASVLGGDRAFSGHLAMQTLVRGLAAIASAQHIAVVVTNVALRPMDREGAGAWSASALTPYSHQAAAAATTNTTITTSPTAATASVPHTAPVAPPRLPAPSLCVVEAHAALGTFWPFLPSVRLLLRHAPDLHPDATAAAAAVEDVARCLEVRSGCAIAHCDLCGLRLLAVPLKLCRPVVSPEAVA